jgi:hypothetical protein
MASEHAVVAVYENHAEAEDAIRQLEHAGFDMSLDAAA